jgi:DNA-binding NarL/FixJ family response regulator
VAKLRLILVDDHEVVRIGLRTLLGRQPNFDIVDEAASGPDAIRKAMMHRPDVVVMDVRLAGMNGIEACKEIKHAAPSVKVIILTSYGDDDTVFDAIAAGADGFVLKQLGSDDLIKKIEEVGRGDSVLDPTTTTRVFAKMREQIRKREESAFSQLTEQELRVLAHLAEGKTNREIADLLALGEGTVRNYVSAVFSKLHVTNRAEAAAYAAAHNIRDYL